MTVVYDRLLEDVTSFVDMSYAEGFALGAGERDAIQLANLQRRFSALRGQVKALDRVATEQGIGEIATLDAAVPLFFPHTVYKSYPLAFLERNRFDALTRWLDGLTALDLSGVDTSGIETIDDWLRRLEATTPLKVNHTFGTTGKLSFVPRTKDQWRKGIVLSGNSLRDWNGPNTGPDVLHQHLPLVAPTYRYGFSTTSRALDGMVALYAGGDDNAIFLYPDGYVSADVASLAGRLSAAAARGDQGRLELSPALLSRRDEFARIERDRPEAMKRFLVVWRAASAACSARTAC